MRKNPIVSLAVALSLLATACGSSADEAAVTTTTTEAPTETSSTAVATTEAPPETEAPSTTEAPVETDPDDPIVVAYCAAGDAVNARIDAADFTDPVQVEDAFAYQYDTMSVVDAPAAIAADVATMVAASDTVYLLLEEYDFDFPAASEDVLALTTSPEFVAASESLDAFGDAYCPEDEEDEFVPAENELGLTEDDVLAMLEDPEQRQQIAEGMRQGTNLTPEQAMCILDETDPLVISAFFSVGVGETEVNPELIGGLFEGLAACELPLNALG